MTDDFVRRREFNRGSIAVLLTALAPATAYGTVRGVGKRIVIRQPLPGDPQREVTLVEIMYRPGAGSPPHVHDEGVMAFVVAGSVASKVGDGPEHLFHAGEAWWEPPGAIHRVSRNASSSEEARLLAIYIAPQHASETDLMRPL